MNFETYTDRAQALLQAAQTSALASGHQVFLPEHILKSMLDDRDQLAANLIRAAGGQPERVTQLIDEALRAAPKVSGGWRAAARPENRKTVRRSTGRSDQSR